MRIPVWFYVSMLLCGAVVVSGCAPSVPVQGARPAEVGLPGVKTLYVRAFAGDYGGEAQRCLLEVLKGSDRFIVLDDELHDRPHTAWAEVRGEVDEQVRERRGRETVHYEDVYEREILFKDAQGRIIVDQNGQPVKVIEEIRERKSQDMDYVEQTLDLTTTVTVSDMTRGLSEQQSDRKTGSQKFGGAETHPKSPVYNANAPTLDQLVSPAATISTFACESARTLARRLVPETYVINVRLAEGENDFIESGNDWAERENWPAAIVEWEKALAFDPGNAAALHNLGVAAERKGDLEGMEKAQGYYRRAMSLDDDDLFAKSVERITGRLAEAQALQRQIGE